MTTKSASEYFDAGSYGLPVVDKPVNSTPAAAAVIGTQVPVLQSEGYFSLYAKPQAQAEFIVWDAAGTSIIQQSGVLVPTNPEAPVESWTVPTPLVLSTNYMWSHKFKSEYGEDYTESVKTAFSVPAAAAGAPTITYPADGATAIGLNITVDATDFVVLGGAQTHTGTTLDVSTDPTFASIDQTIVKTTGDLTSVDVTGMAAGVAQYFRMRYEGSVTGYGANSDTVTATTSVELVQDPTNLLPADGTTGSGGSIQLQASAFAVVGTAQTHSASQWQVATDAGFTNIVFDSGEDTSNLTTVTATGFIEGVVKHYWRVKYKGSTTGFSNYSEAFEITTAVQFADWSLWDGTADGSKVTYSDATINSTGWRTGKCMCPIGSGRFLSVSTSTTPGGAIRAQVLGTLGVVISSGGEQILSGLPMDGSDPFLSITEIGENKALVTYQYSSALVGAVVLEVSGNTVTAGTAVSFVDTMSSTVGRWCVAPIEDDKVLYVNTAGDNFSVYGRVISVSGTTITEGAKGLISTGSESISSYQSGCDVRNGKGIVTYRPGYAHVAVFDIDTTLNTISNVVKNTDNNSDLSTNNQMRVNWISDTQFIIAETDVDTVTKGFYLILGEYDGASNISILSRSSMFIGPSSARSLHGVYFAPVSPTKFVALVAEQSGTFPSNLVGQFFEVFGGNIFYGTPIQVETVNTTVVDIKPINDSTLICTWRDVAGFAVAKILNGSVQ